jgi:hypothetical protein
MLVVWSASTASLTRTIASEPLASREVEAAAQGRGVYATAAPDPTVPPIARDPFAARDPLSPTPIPLTIPKSKKAGGSLRVPDIDGTAPGDGGGGVQVHGVIAGGTSSAAVAIVDAGHGTQFVHVGDALGGRTIKTISSDGIVLSDGTHLGLSASGSGGGSRRK